MRVKKSMSSKSKKPIIGLIGRPDIASDEDRVICIWEGSRRSIIQKGGIPILLLPSQDIQYEDFRPREVPKLTEEEKMDLQQMVDLCDGILIPGGYKWYEYDEVIYEYALKKDIPILGICAGMQMMAKIDVCKNDTPVAITEKNETEINHHQRGKKYIHKVHVQGNTLLKTIVGKNTIQVNSKHNYHIIRTNEFMVSAFSEDGFIEAIELPHKKFVMGVQWHPETMLAYDEYANKIFDEFIEKCQGKEK